MYSRQSKGSALVLVISFTAVVIALGVGVDFLLLTVRQVRATANITDATALEIARDAIKAPGVELKPGFESENFSALLNEEKVSLKNYNRCVAAALVVAANAAADGSPEAIDFANRYIDAVQGAGSGPPGDLSNGSIGARLTATLNQAATDYSSGGDLEIACQPTSLFAPAAAAEHAAFGMVEGGKFRSFKNGSIDSLKTKQINNMVSYVDAGDASNIVVDTWSSPYVAFSSPPQRIEISTTMVNHGGRYCFPGYTPVKFSGGASAQLKPVYAITNPYGEQPHLVSNKTFEDSHSPQFLGTNAVPPNAIKFVSSSRTAKGPVTISIAAGRIGCIPSADPRIGGEMDGSFQRTGLGSGYIEIINKGDIASYNFDGRGTQNENVFAKELMEGIWLADNGAFSTHKEALLGWANFNTGKTTVKPSEFDAQGNLLVHGDTNTINGLKASSAGTRGDGPCQWIHATHGDPDYFDQECASMVSLFEIAYPSSEPRSLPTDTYMAVEQFKQLIRTSFNACGSYGCPAQSTGLRVFTDGWKGMEPEGVPDGRPSREMTNPVPASASSKISRAGSIVELLNQVDPERAPFVIEQLKQRMKEIKAEVADEEMNAILNERKMELGEVLYISMGSGRKLEISEKKPYGLVGDPYNIEDPKRKPIGKTQTLSSEYATIGTIANPLREQDIHLQLFTSYPDPDTTSRGIDIAEWTAGVGGRNNLGRLRFKNQCGGVRPQGGHRIADNGVFCQPD